MQRRSFFRSFLGLPFLPVAKSAAEQEMDRLMLLPSKEYSQVGNWTVFWTDWKRSMTSITLAGQWVAVPPIGTSLARGGWGLYASAPGGDGPFLRGAEFNIDAMSHQQLRLQYGDTKAVAETLKRDALARLMRLIEKYPDPNASFPKR